MKYNERCLHMADQKNVDFPTWEQSKKEIIENLNLEDDIFFSEVLKDAKACRDVLRILLGKPTLEIESLTSQYSIRNIVNRSVILDAFATDGESYFNVELQQGEDEDHIRRRT